ncbi:TetR/AcrR family transcriptional repressor of nem operon [Virgibacillus halotolerans]|uniref:TetR/AcrR family transcriptional regulator n=1 Tax=Virgibacillus halotolerans TaxID=1071053 RepID=UPI0019603760|nr:TetR/AcrR family transcriptional regulator [Virgibacillus halotolerans]MBM7601493.1 TetR/AcrR family transcriptional repressor of nem operon [Virgibacillus halotolerans]
MARNKEYDENEVLRKAMELFWKQGYEKTSMQDLVTHMGIHRRSIYDTFGDKHTLFMKALEQYAEIIETKIETQVKSQGSVKQAIRRLFEMVIPKNEQQPIGCLTVNSAVELSLQDEEAAEKVAESFDRTENLLYELLLHGQKSGEISDQHDMKKLSQFFHNSLVGLRVLTKTTDDKQKLESIIDLTLSVLD